MKRFNYFSIRYSWLFFIFFLQSSGSCELHWSLFPTADSTFRFAELYLHNHIYTGLQNDTVYSRGNIACDFPIVNTIDGKGHTFTAGTFVQAHLVMIPRDLKFAVDNLYAVLGMYLSANVTRQFSLRFYPVYHLSAHLADGHKAGIDPQDVQAISSEMVWSLAVWSPFDWFQLAAGYGHYYHVCDNSGLSDRIETTVTLTPLSTKSVKPFITVQGIFINQDSLSSGIDVTGGVMFFGASGRMGGLALRYSNR